MGKASRKKKETRAARDEFEARWRERRCLHCGAPRDTTAIWCTACSTAAREKGLRATPTPP